MLVKSNIDKIYRLKSKLHNILIKHIYKYLTRVFEKEEELHITKRTRASLYPDFQRILLKIPKWSEKKMNKEYSKFLKWLSKKEDVTEEDLQVILINIIKLSTEILINKPDIYVDSLLQNHTFPTIEKYYLKCLRHISRIVYENPKSLYQLKTNFLTQELENVLNLFLPSDKIKTVLEFINEDIDETNIQIEYDFDSKSSKSDSISIRPNSDQLLIVDKEQSERSLHYVSSDNLHKNYEKSEDNLSKSISKNLKITGNQDDDSVRHIKIPKMKKSQYYYNKPKIDELEEYFFNE
jgi:hypothetical protein